MSTDMNFHVTSESSTHHVSPLFDDKQDPARDENLCIDYTVGAYLEAGVPPNKPALGIPTHARGWTGVPRANSGLYQATTGPAPFPPADNLQTPGVITYLTHGTQRVHSLL